MNSSRRLVLLATGLLLILAGSLALRLVNQPGFPESRAEQPVTPEPLRWTHGAPRAAAVPTARAVSSGDLRFTDWSGLGHNSPIRFQTNLDLIAPIGDGPENPGLWFADFAHPSGARLDEYAEAAKRAKALARPGDPTRLLADDPLLLEAEPWVDQATMRFYPEVWQPDGWETQIPNLMMMITLCRSWAGRAELADDLEAAMVDYRRSIRLGRLLRQEDAVLITDLVGLACIKIGLQGMYARLIEAGESERALVVALALGEHAPQRLKTSEVFTRIDPTRYVSRGWFGWDVDMSDDVFRALVSMAESDSDRRFQLEAILALNVVKFEGTRSQRRESSQLLDRLAQSEDPWIADLAEIARTSPPDFEQFAASH